MGLALIASVIGCSTKPASYASVSIPSSADTNTNDFTSIAVSPPNSVTNPLTSFATTLVTATAATTSNSTPQPSITDNRPSIIIGEGGIFNTLKLTIAVDTSVNFRNDDCCSPHKVTIDTLFTKNIPLSWAISLTFDKAGKYIFWIDDNQLDTGTIIVA
jgi:hypothetical protein